MKHLSNPAGRRSRTLFLGAVLAACSALAACDGLLDVENPQVIVPEQLDDPFYLTLGTSGVVNEFQRAFDDVAYFGAVFTDELRNHATFSEEPLIDQRDVTSGNGTIATAYTQMQRTRGLADSTAARFRLLRGDSANSDLRLARVQVYGGMAYVMLAETYCDVPVNLSAPYTPAQIFETFALPRFVEAIQVATAARAVAAAAVPVNTRGVAGADSLINFARVGAARANLNLYSLTKTESYRQAAISFASQVPANFVYLSYYSDLQDEAAGTNLHNLAALRLTVSIQASVSGTPFESLRGVDPRVPIPTTTEVAQGGLRAYVPNSPTAYTTYSGTLPGAEFTRQASIRVASGLEARYIRAEAEGPTADNIAFIESRRVIAPGTAADFPTTATTSANYYANLRDQRRRDFYLDGHRLGDLRRYRTLYGDNIETFNKFQTGSYLGSATTNYADRICLPVTSAEIAANPNYPRS
ncbi:MAG TPA: RagB/SusD family nutrient uptake outer membrane protein [Longimicrobium sp.]|jgi:hypothetical protein|uniref:RagB/SusD family nutrient uptake outer membrane protein n=1 Tax=Longimicrobium sp. TaxID=2029185 RepID=UPI002EDA753F